MDTQQKNKKQKKKIPELSRGCFRVIGWGELVPVGHSAFIPKVFYTHTTQYQGIHFL